MQYRRFGRTELQMPVFSCGGMRYQFKWQDVPSDQVPSTNQANLEATIRRAVGLGINHIETARGYGSSEMQLGQILPQFPRKDIIVQTKVAPCSDPQEFRKTFETSLAYLQLDYVDLLGIHGLNTQDLFDDTFQLGGCLDVARQLQAEGKVRFVGFSTHGPTEVIQKAIATDVFDYVNLHWYYINQNNWPAILDAQRHDMGIFIISPSDKGGHLYNPSPKLVELCAPLSPIVFNNLFCLSHSQVHTLSVGAARPSDFDEHLKTLALLDRADEVLPPILARLENAAIAALGEDWYKTWHQGLPSHEETPGGINIPNILWLWNLVKAFDMEEYARARYNLMGNGGHWFPGQQATHVDAITLQPHLVNSPHADKIPSILSAVHGRLSGESVQRLSQQD
jgi:uncharacterized protein